MTHLNDEQLAALAPYEEPMRTAYRADYVHRVPGRRALELVNQVVVDATGHDQSFNPGCSACVLRLMKLAGRLYFETLDEIARLKGEYGRITPDGHISVDIAKAAKLAAIDKANDAEAAKLSQESAKRTEIQAPKPKPTTKTTATRKAAKPTKTSKK